MSPHPRSLLSLSLLLLPACHDAERASRVDASPDTAAPPDAADTGGPADTGPSADTPDTAEPAPDAVETDLAALALPATGVVDLGRFATSAVCARCHSNEPTSTAMRDGAGRPVGPTELWGSTMMANAARDPLWRAVVSVELAAHPSRAADIEAKCAGCHAPMMVRHARDEAATPTFATLATDTPEGGLARDGVSCALCHQIEAQGLGAEASFTAGFTLADRVAYGPHAAPFTRPMQNEATFTPAEGDHLLEPALCGSCHTLLTGALDEAGADTGHTLVEQGPYLEWRASAFTTEGAPGPEARTCQACHTPTSGEDGDPITTRLARRPIGGDFPPVSPRAPYGRHLFVGGNTWVPALLDAERALFGVAAPPEAFAATLEEARRQLGRAASLAFEDVSASAGGLRFVVRVSNETGHKLPTAHPTRRAWLRLRVRDAEGRILFESGNFEGAGRLVDGAGRPLPSELANGPIAAHVERVTSDAEVASWEAIMADHEGAPTFILLSGATWLRDDRLLPRGFSAASEARLRVPPAGVGADPDFGPGGDRVAFDLEVTGAATLEAELFYTPLSGRWQAELFAWDTPAMRAFAALFEAARLTPERLAEATLTL